MISRKDRTRIYEEIDNDLRIAFQQMVNEKLPQRFEDLIDQLRAGTGDQSEPEHGK